jgi:CSLREA domain-containing protein
VDASPGNGVCATAVGECTLRAAIQEANALAGDNVITVPAGTYTLTIAGMDEDAAATGDLDITSNITLNGAGAGSTVIQAGTLGVGGPPNGIDRVFHVTAAVTVNISGVTIKNGYLATYSGGGINNWGGTLTITNSTFSGNTSGVTHGGGIDSANGTLTITNSTFSGNSGFFGGAISNRGALTVANSAFSGNSANFGGGIYQESGAAIITNSTFSGNNANSGGGIYLNGGVMTLHNTIVANNASGGNCNGAVNNGGNNLDSGTTCGWGSASGSLSNTDPLLGALTGSPAYFPLNPGSPAIDAADDAVCAAAPVNNTSQNGVTRPQGAHCDIGSFEFVYRLFLPLSLR